MTPILLHQQKGECSGSGRETPPASSVHGQAHVNSCNLDQQIEQNYALIISRLLPELLHEANNELAVLQGSGELLALTKKVPELEKLERRGQTIVKASHRLAGLCRLLERNPSGALTKSSCELTTVLHAVHDEMTMLNSFDKIQWILEQSEPLSVECPAWVVKQVICNLVSRSLNQFGRSETEKKILTQFTSSDTEVSFHWQDNGEWTKSSMTPENSEFELKQELTPVFNLPLCELLLSRYQGRLMLSDEDSGVVTITLPKVSPL